MPLRAYYHQLIFSKTLHCDLVNVYMYFRLITEELFAGRNRRKKVRRYLDCAHPDVHRVNGWMILFLVLEKLPIGWKLADILEHLARCTSAEHALSYFFVLSRNLPACATEIADKAMILTKQSKSTSFNKFYLP